MAMPKQPASYFLRFFSVDRQSIADCLRLLRQRHNFRSYYRSLQPSDDVPPHSTEVRLVFFSKRQLDKFMKDRRAKMTYESHAFGSSYGIGTMIERRFNIRVTAPKGDDT